MFVAVDKFAHRLAAGQGPNAQVINWQAGFLQHILRLNQSGIRRTPAKDANSGNSVCCAKPVLAAALGRFAASF